MPHPTGFTDVVTSAADRERFVAAGFWNDDTLAGRATIHAAALADKIAVVDGDQKYSFARLHADATALAGYLSALGVGSGDAVSIQLPNRYELVVCAVAVQGLGCVINPLLPNYRANELATIFAVAEPKVVITPAQYRGFDHVAMIHDLGYQGIHLVVGANDDVAPAGSASTVSTFEHAVDTGRASPLTPSQFGAVPAANVSEVIFTSGTEAAPKAVMHTEQTANFCMRVAYDDLSLTPDDVVWMPSPLGHSTGFNYGMRFAVYHGLTLVLQDRWDAHEAVRLVQAHRCSYTLAATTFLNDLVAAARAASADLSSLTHFGCGGAAVPASLVDEAASVGITVLRLYGSTEVLVGTWNRPGSTADQRRDTDGTAMSHVDVDIDLANGIDSVPGSGEILVRGPNTAVGFYRDPERTARTFTTDGWVRSGDVGTLVEGYLSVVGRLKEIIIRGGVNIAPREIEDLIRNFDDVAAVAIVGVPDDRLGERACVCIVPAGSQAPDLASITDRLRALGVATYKLPESIHIVDAMPTTASGKIQKPILLQQVLAVTNPQESDHV